MKNLTSAAAKKLYSPAPSYIKKFLLYRRVWDNQNEKYIFAAPLDITSLIIGAGALKWKLDNEGYSVWNTAGVALTAAASDIFADTSALLGARIDIYCGVKDESGPQYIKIFRGFIMREPVYNFEERSYIINLSGELARLASFSAGELAIRKENVLLASRPQDSPEEEDENFSVFTLPDRAVGAVLEVLAGPAESGAQGAQALKAALEYEVDSLNSYKNPAKITLVKALAAGSSIWISYKVWHTDKTMEWIAENTLKLCDAPYVCIEDINYEGTVEAFYNQPSDEDFSQGTGSFTALSASCVELAPSFLTDASYNWEVLADPGKDMVFTPSSVGIPSVDISRSAKVRAESSQAYGTWEVECNTLWSDFSAQIFHYVWFGDFDTGCGYLLEHTKHNNYQLFFGFYKITESGQKVHLGTVFMERGSQTARIRYRICRYPDGSVRFMVKPILNNEEDWRDFGVIFTDNTYSSCRYHGVVMAAGNNYLYSIKLSPQAATGAGDIAPYAEYLSPVIDGGPHLLQWKRFIASSQAEGGSYAYYIRSKNAENSAWGSWTAIESDSVIEETGRYLQLKWSARSDAAQTCGPKLLNWQAEWEAEGANIAMLNTSSLTCLDIMRELARLSGYQIGFDSEGTFFFKKRPSLSDPCLTLSKSDIIAVESVSGGVDKLYNRVSVNFGNYSYTVDEFSIGRPRPNLIDKYGVKELSLSSGALLPAQNANLARACAPAVYKEAGKLKKRAAVLCRFLPQIELGDVVKVEFEPVLNGNMLVEGLEIDLNNWTLRLDLCFWGEEDAR